MFEMIMLGSHGLLVLKCALNKSVLGRSYIPVCQFLIQNQVAPSSRQQTNVKNLLKGKGITDIFHMLKFKITRIGLQTKKNCSYGVKLKTVWRHAIMH